MGYQRASGVDGANLALKNPMRLYELVQSFLRPQLAGPAG